MGDLRVAIESLSPAARNFAGPQAPAAAKMMAARGLSPLTPRDLLTVLTVLSTDADAAIAQTAAETFTKLPERLLLGALGERLDPAVLHEAAVHFAHHPEVVERILLNPATADETAYFLASHAEERQLEIIAQNEIRLLRYPKIIEALYLNPKARMSTVDRVIELAVRSGLELNGIPAFREIQAAILGTRLPEPEPVYEPPPPEEPVRAPPPAPAPSAPPTPAASPQPAPAASPQPARPFERPTPEEPAAAPPAEAARRPDEEAMAPTPLEQALDLAAEEIAALVEEPPDDQAAGPADVVRKETLAATIGKMPAARRIRFAILGNREVRQYLMRDSNRLVASAAIKNPRVTDQEVVSISQSRSVNDEVIRIIASSREWTKNYRVRLNLVNNPKTPIAASLAFLRSLRESDVKALAKNKNVPTAVSAAARRLAAERKY